MKIYKILIIILLICLVSGCTQEKTEPEIQNHIEEPKQEENTDSQTTQETFDEYSVLIAAKVINIRSNPDATNKENITGQVYMGETYTVLEQTKDDKYTWYRIGEDKWIANDGTWCIEFGNNSNNYPYVLNKEEIEAFLQTVYTGGHCFSGYNKDHMECSFINIFVEPESIFDCNILFGTTCGSGSLADVYHYNVTNIVKMNNKTFDVYVIPVENNGYEDYSTGYLRFTDIGTFVADGNPDDLRLCFDITFIQNNNDATDEQLNNIYNVKKHYAPAQFMW